MLFVCGEPKGSQAGRQEGCQAIGVRAGCLYGIESLPVVLSLTVVISLTGLITCRSEPLGSIKIKISTRGKSKQLSKQYTKCNINGEKDLNKIAEIPLKTDGRKPAAATCAQAPVSDRPGTELTPLVPGTYHIMSEKTTHKGSRKNTQDRRHFFMRYRGRFINLLKRSVYQATTAQFVLLYPSPTFRDLNPAS